MAKGELVCCIQCGRDTTSKTKICSRYYGRIRGDEERGRKARTTTEAKSPMEEVYEAGRYDQTASEEYHGGSVRDDL